MRLARLWLAACCRWIAVIRLGQAERWEARARRLEGRPEKEIRGIGA